MKGLPRIVLLAATVLLALPCAWAQTRTPEGAGDKGQAPRSGKQAQGTQAGKAKAQEIQWSSPEQKKRCEGYLPAIRSSAAKARDASIEADPCGCASHAKEFQAGTDRAKADCPPGFLEAEGIGPRMVKNLKTLRTLGEERCQAAKAKEAASPGQTGPPAKGD
jgi:hypothetical protein